MLSYLIYLSARQQNIKNNELQSKLISTIGYADKAVSDSIRFSELLSQNIVQKISQNPNDNIYIKNVLQSFHNVHSEKLSDVLTISMFSWVDEHDQLRINSEFGINKNIDLSSRDYLKFTRTNPHKLILGEPVLGGVSNKYVIPAGMGIFDKNNQYRGSLIMGFDIAAINKKIATMISEQNIQVQLLFNGNQTVIKDAFDISDKLKSRIDLHNPRVQIISSFSFFSSQPLIIYKPMNNQPYGILFLANNPHFLQFAAKIDYVFEFINILLIFAVLMFLVKRNLVNPLIEIASVARKIHTREKNVKIPFYNIREIDELGKALTTLKKAFRKQRRITQENINKNVSKNILLSYISHELRNPLSALRQIGELIGNNEKYAALSEEEKELFLSEITKLSQECLDFVSDLSDINRIEHDNFKVTNLKEEDIGYLIKRVAHIIDGQAKANLIKIELSIENDLQKISCDRQRIKQILINLFTNLIKYSKEGDKIELFAKRLSHNNRSIQIIIANKNCFLNQKEIDRVFENNETTIKKNSKKMDAFALELSLVKYLIERHNGILKITSEVNEGTSFTIEI